MKYLVAVDSSLESKKALLKAIELANVDDEIIILSVTELLHKSISTTIQVDCDYQLIEKANHHRIRETEALVSEYTELCLKKVPKSRAIVLDAGDPKEIICDYVEREHVDILVLGTRDRSGLTKFLLGSVSEHCLHHVKCSVLIVR
eukprot:TRINITY_DN4145_c0_g1_i1.p1 TRINITY_DN4145_c0_g1~~TRINITY_DN4145_c0_g1_i1.p1  ORF type:complete len:146 (+),score=17.20 TRINITY_DN4145_c0_g1_i1:34-471(+)